MLCIVTEFLIVGCGGEGMDTHTQRIFLLTEIQRMFY